jgi:predicted regulator of Ras-like GTPase activity (Roadblock/LC7/MglB family)
MFKDVLRNLVEGTDGAVASILMGFDGITVDSYTRTTTPGAPPWSVETVGAEYSALLGQIKQASAMLEFGTTSEVSVQADGMTTVVRLLNDEYFVALAIEPSANMGRARYNLRVKSSSLIEQLS